MHVEEFASLEYDGCMSEACIALTKIEGDSAVNFWGIFDDLFSIGAVDPSQVEPADSADAN